MKEDREFKGYWWLPERPQQKIPGLLRQGVQNDFVLELFGSFVSGEKLVGPKGFSREQFILGETLGGKHITLYNCVVTAHSSVGLPPLLVEVNYDAQYVLVGLHFESSDELKFGYFQVQYEGLEEWFNRDLYSMKSATLNGENQFGGFEYHPKEPISILSSPFAMRMAFRAKFEGRGSTNQIFGTDVAFLIEPLNPIGLDYFLEEIDSPLRSFLTLAMNQPVKIRTLTSTISVSYADSPGELEVENVEILNRTFATTPQSKAFYTRSMAFTFRDIENCLSACMQTWFEKKGPLRMAYKLYRQTLSLPAEEQQLQFLNYMRALESIHLGVFSAGRKNVKSRRKLQEIFGPSDHLLAKLSLEPPEFLALLKKVRDGLTHGDPETVPETFSHEEMYWLTKKLKLLVGFVLMRESGFPEGLIGTLADRTLSRERFDPY